MKLALQRFVQQRLVGKRWARPEDVVEGLLAVQSQDFTGAKWGVALRCGGDDAAVQEAFEEGKILRTHVLRPTWHFLARDDLRWLVELTATRVHAANAYYYRMHGLDAATAKGSNARIVKALSKGVHLTREELGKEVKAEGNRLAYFIMRAELDALICSGRMRGKQHTYALVEERAPRSRKLERDEALAELASRYVKGHGPAQTQDLAWWSGLTVADSRRALEAGGLSEEEIDGKKYWLGETRAAPKTRTPVVHLLPNYDELVIAFKDRSAMFEGEPSLSQQEPHFVVIDGLIVGGWRRAMSDEEISVSLKLYRRVSDAERKGIALAAAELARGVGLSLDLKFNE